MHRIILIRCDDSSVAVIIARTIFLFLFALFARVLYNPMALPLNTDELNYALTIRNKNHRNTADRDRRSLIFVSPCSFYPFSSFFRFAFRVFQFLRRKRFIGRYEYMTRSIFKQSIKLSIDKRRENQIDRSIERLIGVSWLLLVQ